MNDTFKESIVLYLVILLVSVTACSQKKASTIPKQVRTQQLDSFPKPVGYINDFAGLYMSEQKAYLESLLAEFNSKTEIQVAVITVEKQSITTQQFDDYTLKLANHWGVGKKDQDKGILIAVNPAIRYMRIQNSNSITGILSDTETKAIIDKMFTPDFKHGNFYSGTLKGVTGIIKHLSDRMQ